MAGYFFLKDSLMIHNANVDFVYSWMYIFQVDIETTCWIGGVAGKGTYVMQISRSSMSLLVPRGLCPASKLDGNFAKAVQIRLKVPSSVYVHKSFLISVQALSNSIVVFTSTNTRS